jgi:hypothetical protein
MPARIAASRLGRRDFTRYPGLIPIDPVCASIAAPLALFSI